jgi:hypothetical protein
MADFLNDRPFEHNCRHGSKFLAGRCDFGGGVTAHVPSGLTDAELASDIAEMIGFHATMILDEGRLNGFRGYDNIRFTIVRA